MADNHTKPIALHLANGNPSHLTKSEIEARLNAQIKAPSNNVRAPSDLSKDLKKEFNKLAQELLGIEIMTNLDIDALSAFIKARKLYNHITNKLIENPDLMLEDNDLLTKQDKLFKQLRSAASDLGLTISSRCKLVLPKKQEEKPPSKFGRFGAGKNA